MRFLYIGLDPVDSGSELFRQDVVCKVGGVRQLGHEADYICRDRRNIISCIGGEDRHFEYAGGRYAIHDFCGWILELTKRTVYDFIYIKSLLLYPELSKLAWHFKFQKFGTKVIYEPAVYPLEDYFSAETKRHKAEDNLSASFKAGFTHMQQSFLESQLHHWADVAVAFEVPASKIYDVPAIAVNRGITVGQISVRTSVEKLEDPITMLAVVDDPRTCGFERLLQGISTYRNSRSCEPVTLDIVGNMQKIWKLRAEAVRCHVEDRVNFIGEKNSGEINELCNTHTLAVASLGLYKADRIYRSPYLARFYCAAGIPFIYAYEDLSLNGQVPFAMKMPNFDAPVNMELVSEFVWRCRYHTGLIQQERHFAEENYDWRIIMEKILLFTATGRLEV